MGREVDRGKGMQRKGGDCRVQDVSVNVYWQGDMLR